MVSLALRVVLALIGLEDPDAQAALAEQGFETWAQCFEDFAAMAPGGAVDLSPVRRDMELFFAVVQSRGGAFYVKQSLRLQSTTGSFVVPTSRRPLCVGHAVCFNTIGFYSDFINGNVFTALSCSTGCRGGWEGFAPFGPELHCTLWCRRSLSPRR